MKSNKILSLLALFFLFAATACDDDNDDNDMPNPDVSSYSFTVDGDVEFDAEGQAVFADYFDPEFDEDIFMLSMIPEDNDEVSMNLTFIKSGARPGTGTYPIEYHDEVEGGGFLEDAFVSMLSINIQDDEMPVIYFFEADEGTITFDQSSSTRVSGSFSYHATGYDVMEEQELHVNVSGNFNAPRVDPGDDF